MSVVSPQNTSDCSRGIAPATVDLSTGVAQAVKSLGQAFLTHEHNADLRRRLRSEELSAEDYLSQLHCIAFRLLFLFIAEDRDLLHPPQADERARARYDRDHSTRRLRAPDAADRGSDDTALWRSLCRVTTSLGSADGSPELGLPGLGTFLWSDMATPDLLAPDANGGRHSVLLADRDLLSAVAAMCESGQATAIHEGAEAPAAGCRAEFGAFGSGELGAIYESLLALRPSLDARARTFSLRATAGSRRKSTGAYYTPEPLIEHILNTALDPVLDEREETARAEARAAGSREENARELAVLGTRICDPACGSGHVLVAAAHRLADRLARVRTGGRAPTDADYRTAFREVISSCVYGVDVNPLAAELCRLSLWLESREPGQAMPVLNARIRVGNALLGATPDLVRRGIPGEAFATRTGDLPQVVRYYKSRNARERRELHDALSAQQATPAAAESTQPATDADRWLVCDAWCAAFLWRMHDTDRAGALSGCPGAWDAITSRVLEAMKADPGTRPAWMTDEITRLSTTHRFFHWHLAFPEVFGTSEELDAQHSTQRARGNHEPPLCGFDVVLGNPPFLNQLKTSSASDRGASAIIRQRTGGVGRGYTDLSATFLLLATQLVRRGGRVALVQPQSLLAAADAAAVRSAALRTGTLTSLWVSNEHVFPGASVFTCIPTLQVGGPRRGPLTRSATGRFDRLHTVTIDNDALAEEETWSHLVAAASGVPDVSFSSDRAVGDLAEATADFRDQYYGLEGFLVEDADLTPAQRADHRAFPPVVTTGLVDLAECFWGRAPTRLHKRRWEAPRVDRARMESAGRLHGWLAARLVPKLLLATQTRVVEVVVDREGHLLPSVPVVTIIPNDPSRLWHLAAALASPVCTAIAQQRYAGTALNADAIKLSARQVLKLPVPHPSRGWDRAAEHLRAASEATDRQSRRAALDRMARAAVEAYAVPAEEAAGLIDWWRGRLPDRRRSTDTPALTETPSR